jgi:hypothetical protein
MVREFTLNLRCEEGTLLNLQSLSHRYSSRSRRKKLAFLKSLQLQHNFASGLIVGAKPNSNSIGIDNLIERGLAELLPNLTISGIESASIYWPNWIQADGRNLPFLDGSFDFVFSNATIEHVGSQCDQLDFVNELDRVGKNWVFTTPNRLFPIESHTQIMFLHMKKGWSNGDVTRLLSKKDLKAILPSGSKIKGYFFSPTFICYKLQKNG